jgi:hypothetical protein
MRVSASTIIEGDFSFARGLSLPLFPVKDWELPSTLIFDVTALKCWSVLELTSILFKS